MLYDHFQDAGAALNGCIILYKDEPYQVAEARSTDGRGLSPDRIKLILAPVANMRGGEYKEVILSDADLNYTRLRIGYINSHRYNKALYFFRQPARRNRQGLNSENVWCHNNGYNFQHMYNDSGLGDCLHNKYPPLAEAIKWIDSKDWGSVAITRELAIRKDKLRGDLVLSYKGEEIAWGQLDNFVTPVQYQYLNEAIKEAGVKLQ